MLYPPLDERLERFLLHLQEQDILVLTDPSGARLCALRKVLATHQGSRELNMLNLKVYSSRRPDVAAEEIVLGLINGGLCGGGLSIEQRTKERISFRCKSPFLERSPEHGQIDVAKAQDGRTEVTLNLATTNLKLRAIMWGMLVGLIAVGQLQWWLGWLSATIVGSVVLVVVGLIQQSKEISRLTNRARGYIENVRFIKYQ